MSFIPVKKYEPCPAGMQRAVCVDVVDLGEIDYGKGPKPMLRLVFESEKRDKNGRRFLVSQQFSASWGGGTKKSNLRNVVDSWLGKVHSDADLEKLDTEYLVGIPALVNVSHQQNKKGQLFANVSAVSPMLDGVEPITPSGTYRRDRDLPVSERAATRMKARFSGEAAPAESEAWEESQVPQPTPPPF